MTEPHPARPDPHPAQSEPPTSPLLPPAPGPPGQWRPSEADRSAIGERLRVAVDEGRLDLMEYDRRLRASETAPTMDELHQVVADLPVPPQLAERALAQIGELTVTQTTVYTPAGPIPLRGSQWFVQDRWMSEQKIPTWAIVLAIVGFFCLTFFSLLFLLAKETRFHGTVDVTVTNGQQQYTSRIPINAQQQVHYLYHQVNYVRSLTVR